VTTTTVYEQSQAIHWEAVLITAVPAFTAMVGSIVAAVFGHYNGRHVRSIDKAVNGTDGGAPTIRESVEQINTAVNGAEQHHVERMAPVVEALSNALDPSETRTSDDVLGSRP
jgi:hypothetical protein